MYLVCYIYFYYKRATEIMHRQIAIVAQFIGSQFLIFLPSHLLSFSVFRLDPVEITCYLIVNNSIHTGNLPL